MYTCGADLWTRQAFWQSVMSVRGGDECGPIIVTPFVISICGVACRWIVLDHARHATGLVIVVKVVRAHTRARTNLSGRTQTPMNALSRSGRKSVLHLLCSVRLNPRGLHRLLHHSHRLWPSTVSLHCRRFTIQVELNSKLLRQIRPRTMPNANSRTMRTRCSQH